MPRSIPPRRSVVALTLTCAVVVPIGALARRASAQPPTSYPRFGSIERKDPRLDRLVPIGAGLEKLADGFDWSEGPVWDRRDGCLLFSDVPRNKVFRWKPGEKPTVHLEPSGYSGATPRGGEPGSNGLTFDLQGRLVLCQHGDRRVARLEEDGKTFRTLADRHEGKRFNSPNDVVARRDGVVYFTDPPYGLLAQNDDKAKEIPYNGVYRIEKDGTVRLLTRELTYPNGLAFSPDEKTLYVANSDPERALWMAYPVEGDGSLGGGRVFADVTPLVKSGKKGLPDGLKVDEQGNLFATGPGGVLVWAPDGTHLGTIETGEATGNCAWGDDGSTLYVTADMYLARIRLSTRGKIPGP